MSFVSGCVIHPYFLGKKTGYSRPVDVEVGNNGYVAAAKKVSQLTSEFAKKKDDGRCDKHVSADLSTGN